MQCDFYSIFFTCLLSHLYHLIIDPAGGFTAGNKHLPGSFPSPLWNGQRPPEVRTEFWRCHQKLPDNEGDATDSGSIPGSGKIPCRRKWQPTSVFLPAKSHGQRALAASLGSCEESAVPEQASPSLQSSLRYSDNRTGRRVCRHLETHLWNVWYGRLMVGGHTLVLSLTQPGQLPRAHHI